MGNDNPSKSYASKGPRKRAIQDSGAKSNLELKKKKKLDH